MKSLNIKLRKICIWIFLIIFLTTCSSTRFIYTLVDEYIENEVNFYFDLDEEQNIFLKNQVSEMVSWHRINMLPRYSIYLDNMANMLESGHYSKADISIIITNGRSLVKETVDGLTPFASKFLMRHQNSNAIKFMEKKMATRQKTRLAELSVSDTKLFEKRFDRLKSNFKRFFGNLSNKQMELLRVYSMKTLQDSKIRLNNRAKRQKVFIDFLRNRPAESELTDYINKLLMRGHTITDPANKDFAEASIKKFKNLMANILASSTINQRETIIKKLREYSEDIKNISL